MKLSRERLLREAGATGFRPESLEKVILTLVQPIIHMVAKNRLCYPSIQRSSDPVFGRFQGTNRVLPRLCRCQICVKQTGAGQIFATLTRVRRSTAGSDPQKLETPETLWFQGF